MMEPVRERQDAPKILVLTGMPGSGKGELALVAAQMGIPVFSMGDVVREHFAHDRPAGKGAEVGIYANEQRKVFGDDVWSKRVVEKVERFQTERPRTVIIDGLRSSRELATFRSAWGGRLVLVSVHSSPSTRFSRLTKRGRDDDPPSLKDFEKRDDRELGWGIGGVIALSDVMLVNESDLETFRGLCRDFLARAGEMP